MTDILGLDRTMDMVMGDKGLSACIFPITVLVLLILVCVECEIITIDNKDGKSCVIFHKPSIKNWSNEMYSIIVGVATIIGTVSFAYFNPLLSSEIFEIFKKIESTKITSSLLRLHTEPP